MDNENESPGNTWMVDCHGWDGSAVNEKFRGEQAIIDATAMYRKCDENPQARSGSLWWQDSRGNWWQQEAFRHVTRPAA